MEALEINNYFKNAFIQQISIRDFILYNNDKLLEKCSKAFTDLNNLKKKTISALVKEFFNFRFFKTKRYSNLISFNER